MPATWFPELADGETVLDRVVNLRPAYADAMHEVEAALRAQDVLEPELLELCRLRITQLLAADDDATRASAVTTLDASVVDNLRQWPTAPVFSERQRACIGFAEQVLLDAQGVSDEQAAQVVDVIGEDGFLVLTYACGFFETTSRARILLTDGST
jgi:alkylhydroperoxidase family enzyme